MLLATGLAVLPATSARHHLAYAAAVIACSHLPGSLQAAAVSRCSHAQSKKRRWQLLSPQETMYACIYPTWACTARWPPQIDTQWASRKLWEGYELARALPTHMLGLLDADQVTPQLLLPRLGSLDPDRMDWLLSAPVGDVR